jgi:hypothetical protein
LIVYWLLGLVLVGAVGVIIWAYRRKSAQHAAEREERLSTLYSVSREPAGDSTAPQAPAAAVPAPTRPAPVADVPLPYRSRSRITTQPQAVLYYLLKSALPDHEIFVHLNLAGVIEVAPQATGAERDERRRAISQLTVDCAVCDKTMGVVVAIDLVPLGTADVTFKSRCLEAAGVRYLQIDPVRLPRRGSVRELVLGRPG